MVTAKETSKESFSGELTDNIRIEILHETYKPGCKLVELDLCEKYTVSRTPVRDSLKELAAENLVEVIPNRGAFVIGFSRGDMADIFELLRNAEMQAIRWAIERFYKEELEQFEEIFETLQFYTLREDMRKIRELGKRFHSTIYEASHNRELIRQLKNYRLYIANSVHTKRMRKEFLDSLRLEHAAIFEAFINRAPDEAAEAVRLHIDNAAARALR